MATPLLEIERRLWPDSGQISIQKDGRFEKIGLGSKKGDVACRPGWKHKGDGGAGHTLAPEGDGSAEAMIGVCPIENEAEDTGVNRGLF